MNTTGQYIYHLFLFISTVCSVYSENIPCKKKKESWFFQKYVCVCTSTYCDTIETPTQLSSGQYYHYSTAKATPGFTLSDGFFDSLALSNTESHHLHSSTDYYVTVDSSKTYQTFTGVGGGFSDSSAYNYNLLPTAAQEYLVESFYGKTGIELTYGRVPIGPTDFSLEYYSYDDTVDDIAMEYFNLTEFELTTKMPLIQAAINASSRGVKLLATPWTAPSWMKDNNATDPGVLIPKYHEAFSYYIVKFFEQYKENGVEYWGLSELNEPIFGVEADFKMPNVIMMPNQMRAWTKDYLVPLLADAGFSDLKILALDDERPFLKWYAEALLSDNETAAYFDGFAMHWYSDSESNTDVLDDFNTKYPDKFLLYTEASTSGGMMLNNVEFGGISLGSWDIADQYITNIIQNYQHWSVGYMCWNLCLNSNGGPYLQMSQEAPIIVDSSKGEFYKQPLFYALGHFSKFIYTNSTRIALTVENNAASQNTKLQFGPSSSSFDGIATTNPDGSTTIILYNPSSDKKTLVLMDAQKGNITTTLEAHSINTFMYW